MSAQPAAAASVEPRLSSSVIVVRPGPNAPELFMLKRHARSVMAPLAYVFPGGTVREDDRIGPWRGEALETELAKRIDERSDEQVDGPTALGLHVAALRELFEEAGVLLAAGDDDQLIEVESEEQTSADRLDEARRDLQAGRATLANLLIAERLRPAFDRIVPFSHWVTPDGRPARFDTWFFVAAMPPRQEAIHCAIETTEGVWRSAEELLAGARDGRYEMVFPTLTHLRRIRGCRNVGELFRLAETKRIRRVQPRLVDSSAGPKAGVTIDVEDW